MARTVTLASIEAEMEKVKNEIEKLEEKKTVLTSRLDELEQQKQDIEAKQVMDAFRKSGMEMGELMSILEAKKKS